MLLHVRTLLYHLRAHLWEEPDLSSRRKGEMTVSNVGMREKIGTASSSLLGRVGDWKSGLCHYTSLGKEDHAGLGGTVTFCQYDRRRKQSCLLWLS